MQAALFNQKKFGTFGFLSSGAITPPPDTSVPPQISAGADKRLPFGQTSTTLSATLFNDVTLTSTMWTRVSGPNTPFIATPTAMSTNVSGLVKGTYVFRLTATAGSFTVSDDVIVVVPKTRGKTTATII